jgi:hypothetical protein
LLTRFEHPEWRQMLIHAALRRAEELSALRLLPDNPPVKTPAPEQPKTETAEPARVAGVPASQDEAIDTQDVTGSVTQSSEHSIPIDIGETSSTELPVMPQEERPPAIVMPERSTPPGQGLNELPAPISPPPRAAR